MDRKTQHAIARAASIGRAELIAALNDALADEKGAHWVKFGKTLIDFLSDETAAPPFAVFSKGNAKLPFFEFSTVPIFTCPGMGACGKYCYSLTAWRWPAAFYRQVQNTLLIKEQDPIVALHWMQLPSSATVRLYVNGDIDSLETLRFWMQACLERPDLAVYGYSKSWAVFRAYDDAGYDWPHNYQLNLSSGSKYGTTDLVRDLPIVRGQFVAVPVPKDVKGKYGTTEYKTAVRQSAEEAGFGKVFVCPGKCGACTKKGHACGLATFKNIPIAIGIH